MKINLVIEKIGGLGSKQQRKRGTWGQQLIKKIMCPEFNQINRKVQGVEENFEN